MKLNKKGEKLFDIWAQKYYTENDRLGGDSENGDFVDGWGIIENSDFVETSADLIGLYLYGYNIHVFDIVDEWQECSNALGTDNIWNGIDMSFDEFKKEIRKYFEEE